MFSAAARLTRRATACSLPSTDRTARYDAPARCAKDYVRLGLEVRSGLHTGECELIGDDVGGIAVHIAARVAATAEPNEVLVSSTVRDIVAGSGSAVRGPRRA